MNLFNRTHTTAVATRQAPQVPAPVERLRAYGQVMLNTLDQMLDTDPRSPYALRFRDWAIFGNRYLGFWVDESKLYHLPIDKLAHQRILDRLSLSVHKPVFAVHDPSIGFLYVVQLVKPLPAPQPVKPSLPTLVKLDLAHRPERPLSVPFGVLAGGPQYLDLRDPNHILIGGTTQKGKTAWMRSALLTLCAFNTPEDVKIAIVDPNGQFVHFRNLPHLYAPIATEAKPAAKLITAVIDEMNRRKRLYEEAGVTSLERYTQKTGQRLPLLVLVIDEFVNLAMEIGRAYIPMLMTLVNRSATYGIRLMLATQHPKAEVMDSGIRSQCGIRIAYFCTDPWQSEAILGQGRREASRLPNVPGRFVAQFPGASEVVGGQAYYVDDDTLDAMTANLRSAAAPATPDKIVLTEQQRDMLRFALAECGGYFNLRELSRECCGTMNPPLFLRELAQDWEKAGWLHTPTGANKSRLIGDELRKAAGWPDETIAPHGEV